MKKILILLLTVAGICSIRAMAGETTNTIKSLSITNSVGDVFKNLTFEKATEDGLMFSCKAGLVKAKWEQLPDWCREKYGAAGEEQSAKDLEDGLLSAKLAAQNDAFAAAVKARNAEENKMVAARMKQIQKDRHDAEIAAKETQRLAGIADEEERNRKDKEAIAARSANQPQGFIRGGPLKRK